MSISVGGIDLTQAVIDAQFRVAVLERIVEHLLNRIGAGAITPADIERYRNEAFADLQKRYPQAGLERK